MDVSSHMNAVGGPQESLIQHLCVSPHHPKLSIRDFPVNPGQNTFHEKMHGVSVRGVSVIADKEHPENIVIVPFDRLRIEIRAVNTDRYSSQSFWRNKAAQRLAILVRHASNPVKLTA